MAHTPEHVDRRFILGSLAGVAGTAAFAHVAKAGPLNPPAGSVASSGRTLDEVYNKIPAAIGGGSGEGRIPIPGGTTQVVINQPGSYVLTGNITAAVTPLRITAPNVTLDLGGWTLTCTAPYNVSGQFGLEIAGQPRVTVRNGRTIGGIIGVNFNFCPDVLLEELDVFDSGQSGVYGMTCPGATLRRLRVVRAGAGSAAVANLILAGIYLGNTVGGSPGYTIADCTVTELTNQSPSGTPLTYGIRSQQGPGTVTGCVVSATAVYASSFGFSLTSSGLLRNSTAKNFAMLSDARDGGGNVAL